MFRSYFVKKIGELGGDYLFFYDGFKKCAIFGEISKKFTF